MSEKEQEQTIYEDFVHFKDNQQMLPAQMRKL